ncbi:uncharacterized protein LAESUDRAFT_731726 [Laetiporus sulphureus 93-53]|uniref:Uncharacterized protein n=1 Tax=Laetiporus sulphureus 93-53 TaxID=1314785 RepID=A0A165BG91_9APHY|nr:uncharacterized protein LAESUDRAFT_731726 [Laetiporus sulphureus 93-53]KZT01000.1 hypothetical protein LAESUDRAFT_731726 [Laetiporus sulphureus 93-53]
MDTTHGVTRSPGNTLSSLLSWGYEVDQMRRSCRTGLIASNRSNRHPASMALRPPRRRLTQSYQILENIRLIFSKRATCDFFMLMIGSLLGMSRPKGWRGRPRSLLRKQDAGMWF